MRPFFALNRSRPTTALSGTLSAHDRLVTSAIWSDSTGGIVNCKRLSTARPGKAKSLDANEKPSYFSLAAGKADPFDEAVSGDDESGATSLDRFLIESR